jgi:hypothetical protein
MPADTELQKIDPNCLERGIGEEDDCTAVELSRSHASRDFVTQL